MIINSKVIVEWQKTKYILADFNNHSILLKRGKQRLILERKLVYDIGNKKTYTRFFNDKGESVTVVKPDGYPLVNPMDGDHT